MVIEDKWQLCPDRECFDCGEEIRDEDVADQKIVSGCPYCHYSFVE